MKLTQKTVDAIRPGERRFAWDDALPGFGVRVTEGAVAYVVDFRINGMRRRVALDPTAQTSLAAARERAQEIFVGARRGEDLTLNPRKGEPTFAEVWRRMIDEVDKPKLAAATISDYEDRADRLILPRIGSKRIGDVTAADVDKSVAAASGNRNRAYVATLIKKTINHAKRALLLPDSHRNPAADVAVKRSPKKGRALETEEIARFGAALAAMRGGEGFALARKSFAPVARLRPSAGRSEDARMVARQSAPAQDDRRRQDRHPRGRFDRCGRDDPGVDAARSRLRIRLFGASLRKADCRDLQGARRRPEARRRRAFPPV